jgi:hypothetical protein
VQYIILRMAVPCGALSVSTTVFLCVLWTLCQKSSGIEYVEHCKDIRAELWPNSGGFMRVFGQGGGAVTLPYPGRV